VRSIPSPPVHFVKVGAIGRRSRHDSSRLERRRPSPDRGVGRLAVVHRVADLSRVRSCRRSRPTVRARFATRWRRCRPGNVAIGERAGQPPDVVVKLTVVESFVAIRVDDRLRAGGADSRPSEQLPGCIGSHGSSRPERCRQHPFSLPRKKSHGVIRSHRDGTEPVVERPETVRVLRAP
jgi:hypothetical protein